MSRAADSRFDDVPEPRGRPLECTLCGSGSHNRSMCPWGAENYRMPGRDQSLAPPFLEELSVHLDGQEVPKPHPSPTERELLLPRNRTEAIAEHYLHGQDLTPSRPLLKPWPKRFWLAVLAAIGLTRY